MWFSRFILAVLAIVFVLEASARADDDHAARNAAPPRVGLQLAFRTGYAAPLGAIGNGSTFARTFGGEVPLALEVGGKIQRHIFIGASLGFAVGGCVENQECTGTTVHLGPEIIFDVLPGALIDPWIGYGIGFEYAQVSYPSADYRGWELGHFMAGVDFRLSHLFGIGPFVDLSLAEFTHASANVFDVTTGGSTTAEAPLNDKAFHEWLTLGARFVVFP